MTRIIAIIVAVLAIAVGGYYFLTQSSDEPPAPTPAVEEPAAPAEEPAADAGAAVDEPAADDAAATEESGETPAAAEDGAADAEDAAAMTDPEPAGDATAAADQDTPAATSPAMTEVAPAGDNAAVLDGAPEAETPAVVEPAAAAGLDTAAMAADMPMGNADAPITVIEYGSFTCPHCADFYENVHGQLEANYIDTGKVRFIHREVYFDRFGLWAGMVARCGGPLRYYGIVEMIYDTQRDWLGAGENEEVIENLKKLGRTAGLTNDQLDTCLQSEGLAEALVSAYQTNAEADEITGTPTFIINGEKHPNMSYASFAELLDGLLAE
jgi:protein-disulfide isomerase